MTVKRTRLVLLDCTVSCVSLSFRTHPCVLAIKPSYIRDFTVLHIAVPSQWVDVPDSKVHGDNMGPTWVLTAPNGPHGGPMNLAIWGKMKYMYIRNWVGSAFVQVMACHLCNAILSTCTSQISRKFGAKYSRFHSLECDWKCCLWTDIKNYHHPHMITNWYW